MAWTRGTDTALHHPQVGHLRELEDDADDDAVTAEAVIGFVFLCTSWSGGFLLDGWIARSTAIAASPRAWQLLARLAVEVGILREHVNEQGRKGWMVVSDGDDPLFSIRSREEVERDREHGRLARTDPVRLAVLLRDGDTCRYCGKTVNPKDTRGGRGRTLDHVDPDGDELVVACRTCNSTKGQRTPAQAAMTLRPAPDAAARRWHPVTLAWLQDKTDDPDVLARLAASTPEQAPTTAAALRGRDTVQRPRPDQTSDQTERRVAGHQDPGRDRSGRGRSGREGTGDPGPAPPSRTGKRKRGSRGGRGRPPPEQRTQA